MYLEIKSDLSKVVSHLKERNKLNKIPNNQLTLRQSAVGAELVDMAKGVSFGAIEVTEAVDSYLRLRETFPVIVEAERSRIQIITNVRLHGHTGYSLLDGMIHIKDLVEKTPYGCAITDHGVLYGAVDFYKKMKASGKHPIIGFEAYTEGMTGEKAKNHLILLAKNAVGYQNLVKLSSLAQSNKWGRPLVTHGWLRRYSEGVICLSACLGGELPRAIQSGNMELANDLVEYFKEVFGEDYYIEIQRHGITEIKDSAHTEDSLNQCLVELAKKHEVKVIATDDAHYLNKSDASIHESHLCIRLKKTMSDPSRWKFPGSGYHVHTCEEMEEKFADIPEALVHSLDVIEKCQFEFEFGNYKLPHFQKPEGYTDTSYLEKVAWEGFERRFPKGSEQYESAEYRERLTFELDVISRMGYPSYFLITWDFIKFAKESGIAVGPGRGSACGSLVAYVLDITNLDPIPYNLLFERFLNPDRISMPDIDIDFNHERRAEVIDYCRQKYGDTSVSRIATFGTLSAKSAILDMTRVWDKPLTLARKINKLIPNVPGMTIQKAMKETPELESLYRMDVEARDIIDKALQIQGLPRNVSVHACGVVIADSDVMNYCPQVVLLDGEGEPTRATQFTMGEVEEIGLLKLDFLGLKTMTILQESVDAISQISGSSITIDDIPLNDACVYEHISRGKTTGVFQLEGGGMTSFMTSLYQDVKHRMAVISESSEPDAWKLAELEQFGDQLFERLIAGVSLYRPGPMDEIPHYIDGMIHPSRIKYDTRKLEPILKNTYGILVYQEQVMQAVRELAGFSKGQADLIRKSMGKKIQAILDEYRPYFIYGSGDAFDPKTKQPLNIQGCVNNGITEKEAIIIWEKMENFAKYAFNKSHAAGYGVIAIKTAWLSYYHPEIFMMANLNSYMGDPKKVRRYISFAQKQGIQVFGPSVNRSSERFTVEGKAIRFGLKGIRGVKGMSVALMHEREVRGQFKSFQDFVSRMVSFQNASGASIEALIYSGALDEFEGTRNAKLKHLEVLISVAKEDRKHRTIGQVSLFELIDTEDMDELHSIQALPTPELEELSREFLLEKEEELTGFYITEHPLDAFRKLLEKEKVTELCDLDLEHMEEQEIERYSKPVNMRIAGIVRDVEVRTARNGKPYVRCLLSDAGGQIKVQCFANDYALNANQFVEGKKVIMHGRFEVNDFGAQFTARQVRELTIADDFIGSLSLVSSPSVELAREQWRDLLRLCLQFPGEIEIQFEQASNVHVFPSQIDVNLESIGRIQAIFGEQNCTLHRQNQS